MRDDTLEPVRLFPPRHEGQVLHVVTRGVTVGRAGETISIRSTEGGEQVIPLQSIESVVVHGNGQVTTQALQLLAHSEIPVHWISGGGRYICGLAHGVGGVQRRIRQYQALVNEATCLRLARALATARVESQLRYLLRASRGNPTLRTEFSTAVAGMRTALRGIAHAADVDVVRGHEGAAGRACYASLPGLIADTVTTDMLPSGRSRRPPRDRFNALLSFGYSLLYGNVMQAILSVGLEPAFGFFHTPRSAAHPLVLDVMELFRLPVWDIATIGSVNRRQWDPKTDFDVASDHVWLSEVGRRKAIRLFEARLQEMWQHPVLQYSLSWGRTIEPEVRLLEKEWAGEPGLFARSRLR